MTKLLVYSGAAYIAIFKHPNDTQGIGIVYNNIDALETTANQDVLIRSRGICQVKLAANGSTCVVAHNGYTATGDFTPLYMLDVAQGFGWPGDIATMYWSRFTGTTLQNTTNNQYSYNVSMRVTGSIWSTSYYISSIDNRIKEEIEDIDDNTALDVILAIKPKTYKYVDKNSER